MPIRTFKNKNLKGNFDTIPIKTDRLIQTTPYGQCDFKTDIKQ